MLLESPEILVGLMGGIMLTGLALYTLWQRPDAPAAGSLLLLGATFLAIQISHVLPDGLSVQFNRLALYADGVFGYLLFGIMLGPSLLAFALQFPRPKGVIQRHPWLGMAPFGLGLLVGAALLSGQAPTFGWLATVGMLIASLVSFLHAVRTQREILEGIARGQTNSEIATQLNLSPKTISNSISNILLKVHAADRAKLMLMALDAGMGQHESGS
jgi:DNA-binding CsgD family transcriptional regulator